MRIVALTSDLMDRSRISGAVSDVEFARDAAACAGADVVVDRPRPQRGRGRRGACRRARRAHRRVRSARRHRACSSRPPPTAPTSCSPARGSSRTRRRRSRPDSASDGRLRSAHRRTRAVASRLRSVSARLRAWPTAPMDLTVTDHLLSTTRAVRKRLDLDRPVEREVILECLRLAVQSPTGEQRAELALGGGHRRGQAEAAQGALRRHGPPVPGVAGRGGRRIAQTAPGVPVGRLPPRTSSTACRCT